MEMLNPNWFLKARLKTRQLLLLIALDDFRNIHRAADELHLTQGAVSQQVRLLEGAPKKSKPAPSPSAATLNTVSRVSSELDIRGYETLEAESVVENYLDSAVMAKLGTVTIIHGKGTGALRKAVHEILKRNKAVKSFRLGRYGEGEAGVTVVELK